MRTWIAVFGFLLVAGAAGCRKQGQSPPVTDRSSAPIYKLPPAARTVPAGTLVALRTFQEIVFEAPGKRHIFPALTARDILNAEDKPIVRGGSPASIVVMANPAGGYRLGLHSIQVGGNTYLAVPAGSTQPGRAQRGAPLGALVDTAPTGDSEAEQPAAVAAVEGPRIFIPADTLLFFRLQQPLQFE
jgi:hypothetical protein